jgi:NAD(P)-dependent dehydrogenase (short-subunit alcohol dehydrogenase family)
VPSDLRGKAIVVTGAGRGIGRAVAVELATRGAELVLCARTQSDLDDTARVITDARRVAARPHAIDVGDFDAVARLAQRCAEELHVVGLVNCAGILGPVGRLDTVDMAEWLDAVNVNLAGTAAMCAAFAPQMRDAGGGSIVNFSGGGIGGPRLPGRISAYTASKAAVVVLTESLGAELAPLGVRVNVVAPGPIPTTFMRAVLDGGPDVAGTALYEQTVRQRETAADIAPLHALIAYLLSSESAHITGRFLSAQWDDVTGLDPAAVSGSRFTLRRIDGALFGPLDGAEEPAS